MSSLEPLLNNLRSTSSAAMKVCQVSYKKNKSRQPLVRPSNHDIFQNVLQDQEKSISTDAAVQSAIISYNDLAKEVNEAELKVSSAILLWSKFREMADDVRDWTARAQKKTGPTSRSNRPEQSDAENKEFKVMR